MAAHRAHAHAETVHGNGRRVECLAEPQNLVGLGHAFPLFFGRAPTGFVPVFADTQVFVDPRDQRAAQRHAKVGGLRRREGALLGHDHAVDLQNGALGVVQQGFDFSVQRAVLGQQLAHVLRPAA